MSGLVTISLGSNVNPEQNIRQAVKALRENYGKLNVSPVYQTAAVGFEGEDFLNLVVSFTTHDDVLRLSKNLKRIEDALGRDRSQPKFSARSIDLDLLTYDEKILDQAGVQIPRDEILVNAFVLKPLSDIHGEVQHPVEHKTYAELWQQMQTNCPRIERYEIDLT